MNSSFRELFEPESLNHSGKIAAEDSAKRSWHGKLQLEFTKRQEETVLSHSQVQAPLKVQRPFYPEGPAICHAVVLHTAGGIVGGDRLSIDICLKPEAQALITTAAAGKIYRSSGAVTRQTVQVSVAESACLEWLPQETILFNGAIHRQKMRVDLAAHATWLGWDITRLGRSARGEQFLSGEWRSHTEVWQQNRLLWVDPQWLQGGGEMLYSTQGLAGYPVIGNFVFVGQAISAELVERARSLWIGADASEIFPKQQSEVGVTRLTAGLLCRYRGSSTLEARQWFIQVWHLLRFACLGRSRCLPRVWQM